MYNGNTLQLATSLDDQYFMNDYHELPNYVFPVMEQLCESVSQHKGNGQIIRQQIRHTKNVSSRHLNAFMNVTNEENKIKKLEGIAMHRV